MRIKKPQFVKAMMVVVFFAATLLFSSFAQEKGDDVVIGKYRQFRSKILEEDVTFKEYLPGGYATSGGQYPVVYLMYAQWTPIFANVVSTLEHLSAERIPKMIIIGIHNSGRASDIFPILPRTDKPGGADTFLNFLTEELIPYIDRTYRTENYRILVGGSNAGLFTVYTLLTKPDAFHAYIASSPMLGWCPEFIRKKAEVLFHERDSLNKFLYIPYGGFDYKGYINDHIPGFKKILESQAPKDLIWRIDLIENEVHVPFASLNEGLLALFPDYMVTDEMKAQGLEVVDKHYRNLTKKHGFTINTKEEILFDMAYQRKQQKNYAESISIFKALTERYPASVRGFFFLGETYLEKQDDDSAKTCFKKVLEMDPDSRFHTRAKARLEKLKKKNKLFP